VDPEDPDLVDRVILDREDTDPDFLDPELVFQIDHHL
jgi:hypothetical protein